MTMLALSLLALAAAVVATSDAAASRRLELTDICRYSPDTKVTDENALDLVRCFFATVDTTVAPHNGIFFSTHIYIYTVLLLMTLVLFYFFSYMITILIIMA